MYASIQIITVPVLKLDVNVHPLNLKHFHPNHGGAYLGQPVSKQDSFLCFDFKTGCPVSKLGQKPELPGTGDNLA